MSLNQWLEITLSLCRGAEFSKLTVLTFHCRDAVCINASYSSMEREHYRE